MTKPIATAIVRPIRGYDTAPVRVPIIKSRAVGCVVSFYAPSWRQMAFRSIEAAKAKIERHPGFVGWAD